MLLDERLFNEWCSCVVSCFGVVSLSLGTTVTNDRNARACPGLIAVLSSLGYMSYMLTSWCLCRVLLLYC